MVFNPRLSTISCNDRISDTQNNDNLTKKKICLAYNPDNIFSSTFPLIADPTSGFTSNQDKMLNNPTLGLLNGGTVYNSSINNCAESCLTKSNCSSFQMSYPPSVCTLHSSNQLSNASGIGFPPSMSTNDYDRTSYVRKSDDRNVILGKPINYYNNGSTNKVASGTPIQTVKNLTLNQCANACSSLDDNRCLSFNYFQPKYTCKMYDSSQNNIMKSNNEEPKTDVFVKKQSVQPLITVPNDKLNYYKKYPKQGMTGDYICDFNDTMGTCVTKKIIGEPKVDIDKSPGLIPSYRQNIITMNNRSTGSNSIGKNQEAKKIKINGRSFYECQSKNSKNNRCITNLNYTNNLGDISGIPEVPNPPYQTSLANQNFDIYLSRNIPSSKIPYSTASKMINNLPNIDQESNGLLTNVDDLPDDIRDIQYKTTIPVSNFECQKYCENDSKCTGFMETYNSNGERECKFYSFPKSEWDTYKQSNTNHSIISNLYVKNKHPYLVNGQIKPPVDFIESFIGMNNSGNCRNECEKNGNVCCVNCQKKNGNCSANYIVKHGNKNTCEDSKWGCCYGTKILKNNEEGTNCPDTIKQVEEIRGENGKWKCGDEFSINETINRNSEITSMNGTAKCCLKNTKSKEYIYLNEAGSNCILTPNFAGDPVFKNSMIESFVVNNPIIPQTVEGDGWISNRSRLTAYSGSTGSSGTNGSNSDNQQTGNMFGRCLTPNESIVKNNAQGTNCPNFSNDLGNTLLVSSGTLDNNLLCKFSNGEYKMNDLVKRYDPKTGDINVRISTIVNSLKTYVSDNKVKNIKNDEIKINMLSARLQNIKTYTVKLTPYDVLFRSYVNYELGTLTNNINTFLRNMNLSSTSQNVGDVGSYLKNTYDSSGMVGSLMDWIDLAYNIMMPDAQILPFSTIFELFKKLKSFPFYFDENNKCLFKKLNLKPLAKSLYDKFKSNQINRDIFNKTLDALIVLNEQRDSLFSNIGGVSNINQLVQKIIDTYNNPNNADSSRIDSILDKPYMLCTYILKPNVNLTNIEGCSGPNISLSELASYYIKNNGNSFSSFKSLVDNNYYLYLEDLYFYVSSFSSFKNEGLKLPYVYNGNVLFNANVLLSNSSLFPMYLVDESRKEIVLKPGFLQKLNLNFILIWSMGGVVNKIKNLNMNLTDSITELLRYLGTGVVPLDVFYKMDVFNEINTLILAKLIVEKGNGDLTTFFNKISGKITLYKIKNCLSNYEHQINGIKSIYENGCCWDGYTNRGINSDGCTTTNINACFSSTFGCCQNKLALPTPQYSQKIDLQGSNC